MTVPSLFYLASNEVAKCLLSGKYKKVNIVLPPPIANKLYNEVRRTRFPGEEVAQAVSKKLNLTTVNLSRKDIDWSDIYFLNTQDHLEYVNLGWPQRILDPYRDKNEMLKIVPIIEDCFNRKSRKTIRHLGLTELNFDEETNSLAFSSMAALLPNLVSLDLNSCPLDTDSFALLCNSFPNLINLDVSLTDLENLTGISKLTKLQVLGMRNLLIERDSGIAELCRMKSLRVIDVEARMSFTSQFLAVLCDCLERLTSENITPLPSLEIFDCTATDMSPDEFEIIQASIPSLRLITLVETPLQYVNLTPLRDTLKIINCGSMSAFLETLRFFRQQKKAKEIERIITSASVSLRHSMFNENHKADQVKVRLDLVREIVDTIREANLEQRFFELHVWQKACKILQELCKTSFIKYFTREEVHGILDVYRVFRCRSYRNFWNITELHQLLWTMLSDLCLDNRLTSFSMSMKTTIDEAIEVLTKSSSNQNHVAVFGFVEQLFKNQQYFGIYKKFLENMLTTAKSTDEFCQQYARHEMIKSLFLTLNFENKSEEKKVQIEVLHLKIIKRVVLSLRGQTRMVKMCEDAVLRGLIKYLDGSLPLSLQGHYAFAILWIVMEAEGRSISFESKMSFELVKIEQPLEMNVLWRIIEDPDEMALEEYAKEYSVC